MSQFFRHVGGRFIGGHAYGFGGDGFLKKNPSISA